MTKLFYYNQLFLLSFATIRATLQPFLDKYSLSL